MLSMTLYREPAASVSGVPSRTVWRGNDCCIRRHAGRDGFEGDDRRGLFFALREAAGVVAGALQEHWRALGGEDVWLWFPTRRFTMRTEFRFPKATAVLMAIILGGVMLAIQKGENISASLRGAVDPPIGPIHPTHSVLLGGIVLGLVILLRCGNDRVGDSIRDAPLGSAPAGRNCGRAEIASRRTVKRACSRNSVGLAGKHFSR